MKQTKRNIYKTCLLLVVALILVLPFRGGDVFAKGELVSAPMNPEFVAYMESLKKEGVMAPLRLGFPVSYDLPSALRHMSIKAGN